MINMKRYAGGKKPYELFSEAVDRKDKSSADTIALNAHKHKVEIAYRYYERAMDNQKLGLLTSSTVLSRIKHPLLGMYSSGCKLVKDFRTWHFNNNSQTYNNVCPYCTINSAITTEHILPQEVYPEYAANVFNLIPACSECNSYKGDEILDENGQIFTINYYTDTLPDIRYLFAKITSIEGGVQFEYYLENLSYIITHINPKLIIHRISGYAPKDLFIAPEWNTHKKLVLNGLDKILRENDLYQGIYYKKQS